MTVIGIVGLPGSGKSEAADVAREMDIPVVTMGDVVRAETESRGLDPASDHGQVAQVLREEEGLDAIARRSLPIIRDHLENHGVVVVDGIRSGDEVATFESAFEEEFTLVEITASKAVRAERVTDRGRDKTAAEGGEDLAERETRELGFGMADAMDRADVSIPNEGTLESFRERVRTVIEEARPE